MSKYLPEILLHSVLENEPLDTLCYNFNYSSLELGKVDLNHLKKAATKLLEAVGLAFSY